MRPANAKPFLFETSFDEEQARRRAELAKLKAREQAEEEARQIAEAEDEPDEPPPPSFTEEELTAARAAAWQEGHEAGMAEASQGAEARLAGLIENIAAELSGIHVHQDLANERLQADMAELGVRLVRKLLPAYAERHGLDEIRSVLEECLEAVPESGKIIISVTAENRTMLDPQLDALAARSGYDGRLSLLEDAALGPSEVTVRWDGGGLDRLEQPIWDKLDMLMARMRENLPAEDSAPAAATAKPDHGDTAGEDDNV